MAEIEIEGITIRTEDVQKVEWSTRYDYEASIERRFDRTVYVKMKPHEIAEIIRKAEELERRESVNALAKMVAENLVDILEALGAHVPPPVEVARLPLLESPLKASITLKVDVVRDLLV